MHRIEIEELNMVPEGKVFRAAIGCQTFYSPDKYFVAKWVGDFIKDPEGTTNSWYSQPWNQDKVAAIPAPLNVGTAAGRG